MKRGGIGAWLAALCALWLAVFAAAPAHAANCSVATAQGTTGPSGWQTYCWIDFSGYNNTTATSSAGQNFSLTLQDGTVMTFNLKVSTPAPLTAIASPSWSGASIGNTAFLGIAGKPVLYQTGAGTSTVTISNVVLTPPSGATAISAYMLVAADGESTNNGESLAFQTNGGNWTQLDQAGPISGSIYPTVSGLGTSTVTETGAAGTVGAYVFGSSTPTAITTTLVGGGLQGAMFAVRFASIRLTAQIAGARAWSADQFTFNIKVTSSGTTIATGTSSGTGLGPFTAAALSTASSFGLTLNETMAAGSTGVLGTDYATALTCTNASTGSTTPLPSNVATTNYNFGNLQYGDAVVCTFTDTPYPHLQLQKALGSGGRQFNTDQFTLNLDQIVGSLSTTVSTTTTTGTGTTVSTGATANYLATAGSTYSLYELPAGTTTMGQYSAAMACTNANASSTTTLPAAPGGKITPKMGDVILCTITNTRLAANAQLTIIKSSSAYSDPVNATTNPKLIPGGVLLYTITVANTGPSAVDNNTVVVIDALPAQLAVGTASAPGFAQGTPSSGLTFTAATDVRYSNASTTPASFAACTYTPAAAYDPAVRFVCFNPKGTMAGSTGVSPSFSVTFLAQIQ